MKWQSYGLRRWRRHMVPLAVWLTASAGIGLLFSHRAQRVELVGIAQGEQRQIAALTDGRLLIVPVQLFEQVSRGQTLAVLEDDRIKAGLATAAAEVARLRAELAAAENRFATDAQLQEAEQMGEARRFAIDVEQIRLKELELKVVIGTDRITLQRWQFKLDRLFKLEEQQAANAYELEMAQTKHAVSKEAIAKNEKVLARIQLDLQQALKRQENFAQNHPALPALDKALEPLRAAMTVQQRLIDELSLERSMLVLRSPMDGIVSELLRGAGEALLAGEPILTVVASQPSEVIAYATAEQAWRLDAGTAIQLEVTRHGSPRRVARSHVLAVSPTVEQLPIRLWKNPAVPEWGWPVKIAIVPQLGTRSGELVGIRVP